jgi:hypothetical protein
MFLCERRLDRTRRRIGHARIAKHKQHPSLVSGIKQGPASWQKPSNTEVRTMGYGIAWLLGVPVSILIIWFIVSRVL